MTLYLGGIFVLAFSSIDSSQYPGQICIIEKSNEEGLCKIVDDCPAVITSIQRRHPYTRCGFEGSNEIVCCPGEAATTALPITTTASTITISALPKVTRNSTISQQKCKEYSEAVYEYVESISFAVQPERIKTKVDKCGHKFGPFIGVEEAKPREFPHLALIGYDAIGDDVILWQCAGSLISAQFVLTTGHCSSYDGAKYIRLGEIDLLSQGNDITPETFSIAQIFTHPEYQRGVSIYNDIGLIKMDQKVKLTPLIRPACLPTTFDGPEMQAIATHIERKEETPNTLLKVTLNKFTYEECSRIYAPQQYRRLKDGIREQTQLCAGPKTPDKDTCQGDSGGPLQVFHANLYCMYTVIALTASGVQCGNISIPGIYTRVYHYVDWIESIVWDNE